ncbi:MAG: hypothetical protein V1837_04200 [Candidatus Woesearchaeota archaeon]
MKPITIIALLCLFLVACSVQQPVQSPTAKDLGERQVKTTIPDKQTIPEKQTIVALPNTNFSLRQIESLIYSLSAVDYEFSQDLTDEPIVSELRKKQQFLAMSENTNKFFVVQQLKQGKLQTLSDFYNFEKSPDWQLWRYYINETKWHWAYKPLSQKELARLLPGYSYLSYTAPDSDWIDVDIFEQPVMTSLGPILEYRMFLTKYNQFGFAQDEWQPAVILYKVPCSESTVFYLRPKRGLDFGYAVQLNQKKSDYLHNWDREILKKQPLMINYSESIMRACGLNRSSFTSANPSTYEDHFSLVVNNKVYFKKLFNFSMDARVSLREKPPYDAYHIEDLNLSFVYSDKFMRITDYHVSVKILINDSGWIKDYAEYQIVGDPVPFGRQVQRNFSVFKDITFGPNATIILIPYLGTVDTFEAWRYYIGEPIARKIS